MSGPNGTTSFPLGFTPVTVTGPMLVAHLLNCGLLGVLTVQAYIYYIAFPRDHWRFKALVALAYALEIVQTMLSIHDAFRVYGSGWGNLNELDAIGLIWISIPILDSMISMLSEMFYTWRIYSLSRNLWLVVVILTISLVELGAGIYEGVACLRLNGLAEVPIKAYKLAIVWAGAAALAEIVITCSMFYYLREAKKESHVKRTTTLLTYLIKLSIETGFICAAVALAGLILFITSPTTTCYQVFALCASKLVSNCFVAVLNSRIDIVGGRNASDETDLAMSVSAMRDTTRQFGNMDTLAPFGTNRTGAIKVEITRDLEMHPSSMTLNEDARKLERRGDCCV
ncbi:hypothetical protein BXZ70DRAFT_919322 [Cristinia sonorae]|uniref:DUF6534 domain-containing protein n=1 Tax=Cristinia sonorae TaxID=1940300 RepID=A0A8K0XT03_9AGAR|nr:hypothetical protein BXZ70DRAFT_919322 [Cristinia sonorae]